MSISAITSGQTSAAQLVQQAQAHAHGHGHGMRKAGMQAAATALGMSPADLQSALKGGQTLTTVAASKGVSMDTLTSAITTALGKANPALSSDRAATIAQRMIEGPAAGQAAASGAGDRDHDGDSR